jgi:hypothetical protein
VEELFAADEVCLRVVDARDDRQIDHGQIQDHIESCLGRTASGAARRHLPKAPASSFGTRRGVGSAVAEGGISKDQGLGAEVTVTTGHGRTIGIVRARCKIGMTNLVYNMRRFVCLKTRIRRMTHKYVEGQVRFSYDNQ